MNADHPRAMGWPCRLLSLDGADRCTADPGRGIATLFSEAGGAVVHLDVATGPVCDHDGVAFLECVGHRDDLASAAVVFLQPHLWAAAQHNSSL